MYNMTDITTLYVSQKEGNDDHQGFFPYPNENMTGPLQSVECALEMVADLRRAGGLQPLTIKIMDDIYYLEKPIIVSNKIRDLTIEPYTKTILSGGRRVNKFVEDTFNGHKCVSVDVSDMGDITFTDFYVNGSRAGFTRYPQDRMLQPEAVENNSSYLHAHSRWFIAKKEDLEIIRHFRNFQDCFISYNHYWVDEHTPIKDYDLESGKITFEYPSRYSIELTHPRSALEYIIENTAEGFQNPNEWYYDRPAKRIYYIPKDKEVHMDELEAYIPITEKLIRVVGTPGAKVENVLIRNFDMAYTKGDYRSTSNTVVDGVDFGGFASDGQSVCSAHGSVEFYHASHCGLEHCRLFCLGVHAIVAEEGSDHIRIIGNDITEIGAGAIRINGGEYKAEVTMHTFGNVICDNSISYCGKRYYSACGILIMHSYDNTIAHNTISWLYYSGISCGWVWGYAESISHHNLIEKNHIHHIGQGKLSDMGGIYLLGKQHGTIVRNNLIHDVESKHYGGWALYTDEGSSYMLLENNVSYNTSSNCFYQHYGQMNTVRNNIFAFSKEQPVRISKKELHTGIVLERNIIITDGMPAYRTGYDERRAGCLHMLSSSNNIFWDVSGVEPIIWSIGENQYSLKQMQEKFGRDIGSVVLNPGFTNIEKYDFTLKEDCEVVKLGFHPIDITDCGIRR